MSITFYLRCRDTKKTVHAAEQSSRAFSAGFHPKVLTAFLLAHEGKNLEVVRADDFDDFMEYEEWTPMNCAAEYMAIVGRPFSDMTREGPR